MISHVYEAGRAAPSDIHIIDEVFPHVLFISGTHETQQSGLQLTEQNKKSGVKVDSYMQIYHPAGQSANHLFMSEFIY